MSDLAPVLAAIERNRKRLWAVCYRMTGSCADADDLSQEAIARAIERASQLTGGDPTGWLLSIATRACLDHLRRAQVRRRLTELVDPLDDPDLGPGDHNPETELVLREDVRIAVIVALQALSPKQRAAVILRDVCDRSLDEVAAVLDTNANAVKALLHRGRAALATARHRSDVDVPVDAEVVQQFADAIRAGSIERITELLAEDVWGMVDGGGVIQTASKPTYGRAVVAQQWANAKRKVEVPVTAELRRLNGENAIVIRLEAAPDLVVAIVHLETRDRRAAALRVNRDPVRLSALGRI